MNPPSLEVRTLNKRLGVAPVFDHVSLAAGRGELLSLPGASGRGKHTLVRTVAGEV